MSKMKSNAVDASLAAGLAALANVPAAAGSPFMESFRDGVGLTAATIAGPTLSVERLPHYDSAWGDPAYARPGDAGFDLRAAIERPWTLHPGERRLFATGLAFAVPEGFELQVRPRSGLALKHGITVVNTPGTIDAGYRGEVGVLLINHGRTFFEVKPGDRIAQAILAPVYTAVFSFVDVLPSSDRGDGGFGSTGQQ